MIKTVELNDDSIVDFLKLDPILNYFMLIGLEMNKYKTIFDKAWGDTSKEGRLRGVLLKRKTGNMQFYGTGDYDVINIVHILKKEGFQRFIGEESIIKPFKDHMVFSTCEYGAFISRLSGNLKDDKLVEGLDFKTLKEEDIDRVVKLYNLVFKGFAPERVMREKLRRGTGRGYYIEENGEIVSIAQSAYEFSGSAVIVGVATHPDYRNKGLGSQCLIKLCKELVEEGRELFLQYDNQGAGNIYRRLGFIKTGRMLNCYPIVGECDIPQL